MRGEGLSCLVELKKIKLAFTEDQWLTEVKNCDIQIIFRRLVVVRVLCLAADRVAQLSAFLGEVVVAGPHCDVLSRETERTVSGSENLLSAEDGTSTGSLEARHGQSDMPGKLISQHVGSTNNSGAISVGSSALILELETSGDGIV